MPEGSNIHIPGVPASEPASLAEPTSAREPLPPKPDQRGPEAVSPTGSPTGAPATARAQSGQYLTTAQGLRLGDTDHSLKAGPRGPILLQDHHLREKITHFDHERIPERVVHARGAGAHGVFRSYGTAANITRAGFLAKDVETPVFVRFSTVLGSRGSADTVRDTSGLFHKVLHGRGHLRPGGQQHSGLLYPGRHQVSRTSSMLRSHIPTGRSRRRRVPTIRSGTSFRFTPRPRRTPCGTCPTGVSRVLTGPWRALASIPSGL